MNPRRFSLYLPLVLHLIPTLGIGYFIVIPQSCIAGVNELTIGFAAANLGFVLAYVAGLKLRRNGAPPMRRPRFIAEQARHASGLLGRVIAFIMARETWAENQRAIDALDLRACDHVIDIGCGHGRSLGALAARAANGRVVGIDPSDLMAEIAVDRNRALIKASKVEVATASAGDLPFDADAFDKALCVHVIYFWKDLRTCFREIARVLKPNGRLVLVFRTDADKAATVAFPADVYSFRSLSEVTAALSGAGFAVDEALLAQQEGTTPALLVATKQREASPPALVMEQVAEDRGHAR